VRELRKSQQHISPSAKSAASRRTFPSSLIRCSGLGS
jgi:hypothetical protein